MTTLPKPKHCEENWLDMTPTEGGRICKQCSKTIVDFSKMTWVEIEKVQQQNNNSVCGMYSPKQLNNWGRQVQTTNCSKFAATTALIISLTTAQANAQDNVLRTIIHGTVTGKSQSGTLDTLGYTNVILKGTKIAVIADEHGRYKLDITDYIDTVFNPTIVYSMIGFRNTELRLSNKKGDINFNAQLDPGSAIIYSITKPTIGQKIKWKIRRWFGRKEE